MSRNDVKQLCASVLDIPIANGTIQKIVDRTSKVLFPVYEHIGQIARCHWCNHIDETSSFNKTTCPDYGPWSTIKSTSIASIRLAPRSHLSS